MEIVAFLSNILLDSCVSSQVVKPSLFIVSKDFQLVCGGAEVVEFPQKVD